MRSLFSFLFAVVAVFAISAQTQIGYVKTKGRLLSDGKIVAGSRISGATIQVKNRSAVVSDQTGNFSFPLSESNYYLQSVSKNGYVLTDRDILSKQYEYSINPLVIVLETPDELLDEQLAAERKIRRTLQRDLQKKEDEIEALKEQNRISAEDYRQRLQDLYNQQEKDEKLIAEMAERYAKIDYDQLDDFNRKINEYILNGELSKADSLLNTKGDIVDEINNLKRIGEANVKEAQELSLRQSNLAKSKAYEDLRKVELAQWCMSKHEICKTQHDLDSAAHYIELRASIDPTNGLWLFDAGRFLDEYKGDYDKALDYYQKALPLNISKYGQASPDVAMCYSNIGLVLYYQGNYHEALCFHQNAMTIRLEIYGEQHQSVANTYSNIGLVYDCQGLYAEAMDYYQKALKIRKSIYGDNHIDLAMGYNDIGRNLCSQGAYSKALEYHKKALEIYVRAYGEEHPDEVESYNSIGNTYYFQGRYSEALEYYKKALAIMLEVYNDSHPHIASSYNNIGNVLVAQGYYSEAMDYYLKALNIYLTVLGEKHTNVAMCWNNLGRTYDDQAQYSEALDSYCKALAIYLDAYGETHPDVADSYNNIGNVYKSQGRYTQALESHQKALAISLALSGDKHPDVATSYNNMGLVYSSQERYLEALESYQKALEIFLDVHGKDHPDIAMCYNNIGSVYDDEESYTEALDFYRKALAIYKAVYGEKHPYVAKSYDNMGVVLCKQGQYTQALFYHQMALSIKTGIYGKDHQFIADSYYKIGAVQQCQNNYAVARDYYTKALDIYKRTLGDDHPLCSMLENEISGNSAVSAETMRSMMSRFAADDKLVAAKLVTEATIMLNNRATVVSVISRDSSLPTVFAFKMPNGSNDDFNRKVSSYIISGKIPEIETTTKSLDNNRELKGIDRTMDVIWRDMDRTRKAVDRSMGTEKLFTADAAQGCYAKYVICKTLNQLDSAAYYIECCASIDSTNVTWQVDAGNINYQYKSDYDMALKYYRTALRAAIKLYGDAHVDNAAIYNNIGNAYYSKENYADALKFYRKALSISGKRQPYFDTLNTQIERISKKKSRVR